MYQTYLIIYTKRKKKKLCLNEELSNCVTILKICCIVTPLGSIWFNKGEGRGGILIKGRGCGLIKYIFGSKEGEGRGGISFNQKYIWCTREGERI